MNLSRKLANSLNFIYPTNWKNMTIRDNFADKKYNFKNLSRFIKTTFNYEYSLSYDTETYKGKCKLIARNKGSNNYVLNPTFENCLDFMFYNSSKPNGYRFFYNIDFDISAILKLWNNIGKITDLKNAITVKYKKYKLYWLKGKMFKLTKNKKSVAFTDLLGFYKLGLDKAVKQYLNVDGKQDIDGNLLNTSYVYWIQNLEKIIDYCIYDCKLTNKLAKYLVSHIIKTNANLPRYLVSAGSLAKSDFRFNCFIPNFDFIPKSVIQIAYNCYYGGKFEIQKKGYFKKLWLYDINSQYPSFIKDLPNLNFGVWKRVNYISLSRCLGYYLVDLDIPLDIPLSTIMYKLKNGKIINVIGKIKNKWLTWFDLDLMREFITKIHFGIEFIPTKREKDIPNDKIRYYFPFRKRILFHYAKKSEYKGNSEIMYNIHKLTMNALYGSFIERHDNLSVGVLFNPIYASQTTAFGRWSVIKDIPIKYWHNIDAIHTDSIISDKKLSKYLILDNKLGNWSLETKGKGLIINTGMYQINDICKTRGIPKKFITDNRKEVLENIKKSNWFDFCQKYSDKSKVKIVYEHMRKLSEGLIRNKSLENVNIMFEQEKSVSVNSDVKRCWIDEFKDFDDLLSRNIESYMYFVDMKKNQNKLEVNKNLFLNILTV